MRIALLGTGKMGGAMAHRLASFGFYVTLWNRTPARATELHVGTVAASPAEAARGADLVISSLTNDVALREVYLGGDGAFSAGENKVFVDMSTAGPDVIEELGREAHARNARLISAPVIGSLPAVAAGKLLILAGGAQAAVEEALPVLEYLDDVHYVGERESAQRLKLIANSMLGITSAAAAELLVAGTAMGLDPRQVFSILERFAPGLAARERGFLRGEHAPTMFAVRDLVKDIRLGLRAYEQSGAITPLIRDTSALYEEAMSASAELDISAVIEQSRNADRTTIPPIPS
jgi:3-hydroxyisobutyrate dehydrogenase-like beta-hydroxyacid dehydrogenase